jgi:hypothetical protein
VHFIVLQVDSILIAAVALLLSGAGHLAFVLDI